ncbi:DUF115 domain-containing protein [Bacillus sp. ISL-41]|uniref:6-hydroxymethylpterin diphosphokinase MptE-like protein n=1 Tax=Bacillus sp. ISL-41 TaxID=2819127 RepID=UPI001BE5E372|nr:6-hydroxymethylpterin diphosphokinase MptE-like protein [Bacillus sp. ISL-41]MBT2642209.1 DUF115 domain-containing protein [Bacillus sp. ISL-41]
MMMLTFFKKVVNNVLSWIIWNWKNYLRLPFVNLRLSQLSKRVTMYKNKHLGESCFIIGNGPSLSARDLNRITGIPSFSSNRINLILDRTLWKPYYYTIADSSMANKFIQEIDLMEKKQMFAVVTNYGFDTLKNYFKTKYIFLRSYRKKDSNGLPIFSKDPSKKISTQATVTYVNIQLATYMGFKKIYLIGVDNNYAINKKEDGTYVINKELIGKDHFDSNYYERWFNDRQKPTTNTELMTKSYIAAKKYCDEKGVEIYNATKGGSLEVFPRVNFDGLFDDRGNFIGETANLNRKSLG